jgi:hypothetical protein
VIQSANGSKLCDTSPTSELPTTAGLAELRPASTPKVYHQKLAEKRWSERWPLLEVVPF